MCFWYIFKVDGWVLVGEFEIKWLETCCFSAATRVTRVGVCFFCGDGKCLVPALSASVYSSAMSNAHFTWQALAADGEAIDFFV